MAALGFVAPDAVSQIFGLMDSLILPDGKACFEDMVKIRLEEVLHRHPINLLSGDEWKVVTERCDRIVAGRLRNAAQDIHYVHIRSQAGGHPLVDMLENWVTDAAFMKQLFATLLLVATLGAGFTFQTIFAELPQPQTTFSKEYVQTCLAASWLLFILCVATAAWCPAMVGLAGKVKSRKLSNLIIPANAGSVSSCS